MTFYTKLFSYSFHIAIVIIFLCSNLVLGDGEDTLNQPLNKLIKEANEIKGPNQAFQLNAILNDLGQIELTWLIDKQCFLYKDKLEINISPEQTFTLVTPNSSTRQDDEYFGDVEVFYDELKYFLSADFDGKTIIDLVYQGCNETGFCYPPIERQLILDKSKKSLYID